MGMTQKIGICGALVHQPRLLILDEPFTGLDPLSCITLIDFLNFYRQTHTLIISSHDLSYMEKICNQIVLIDSGTIIYDGGIEKFTKNGQSSLETSFLGAIEAPLVRKEIKWII